jgi:hypothetical protein
MAGVREPMPRFWTRQDYDSHFLKGTDRNRPLSYETQLKWVNEVFGAIGLSAGKKTHLG